MELEHCGSSKKRPQNKSIDSHVTSLLTISIEMVMAFLQSFKLAGQLVLMVRTVAFCSNSLSLSLCPAFLCSPCANGRCRSTQWTVCDLFTSKHGDFDQLVLARISKWSDRSQCQREKIRRNQLSQQQKCVFHTVHERVV